MKMHEVEIRVSEGEILLIQNNGQGENDVVYLTPEQVPAVCEWMKALALSAIVE